MKKWCALLLVGLLLGMVRTGGAAEFSVESPQLEPNGRMALEQVYKGFGCSGDNVSPELKWRGAPGNTKSFAVTAYDPDAPTGSGWWHWVIFNIPTDVDNLPINAGDPASGKAPAGSVQSRTDYGTTATAGPARRPVTSLTAISSPSIPWTWTNCPWTRTLPPPW